MTTPKAVEIGKQKESREFIRLKYHWRVKKKDQREKNFEIFLEMFKKPEINIPFFRSPRKKCRYTLSL